MYVTMFVQTIELYTLVPHKAYFATTRQVLIIQGGNKYRHNLWLRSILLSHGSFGFGVNHQCRKFKPFWEFLCKIASISLKKLKLDKLDSKLCKGKHFDHDNVICDVTVVLCILRCISTAFDGHIRWLFDWQMG